VGLGMAANVAAILRKSASGDKFPSSVDDFNFVAEHVDEVLRHPRPPSGAEHSKGYGFGQ
jgi:hypothetical protein